MLFHPEAEKAFNLKAFKLVSLIEEKKLKLNIKLFKVQVLTEFFRSEEAQ